MTEKFSTDRYELAVPDGWDYESSPECVAFFRVDDGHGAITISSIQAPPSGGDPNELFREFCDGRVTPRAWPVSQDGVEAFGGQEVVDGRQWRYWIFMSDRVAVVVSYNCHEGSEEFERDEVNHMVKSLRLLPA